MIETKPASEDHKFPDFIFDFLYAASVFRVF